MKFRLSDDLVLGADLVVSTAGIFATKGLGKTHLAQVMAEEMLSQGQTIVVIDPTDAWYGLRSSADGKHEGYPIVVIGGDHGVLKLDPDPKAGVQLAEAIVAERFSCVICTDGLDDTIAIRYVREVLSTIFKRNRDPIHIFVDECDIFAPQQPKEQEDHRCIRALSHVVRRGRKKGIGTTLITQRPAELNASVRTMIEMLFVLGMSHNLDIDAVEKWMRLRKKKRGSNAAFELQEEMIASLDALQQGDAWAWAPRLGILKRFRARAKRTFDSGATPKPGQKVRAPKKLASVDLERLGQAMAAAVQRQKENDPAELKKQLAVLRATANAGSADQRARIAQLEKELSAAKDKVPVKPADLRRLEALVKKIESLVMRVTDTNSDLELHLSGLRTEAAKLSEAASCVTKIGKGQSTDSPKTQNNPAVWRTALYEALCAGGCSTSAEWATKYPGQHCWFVFRIDTFESCALCGVVRSSAGQNKPCKGLTRVELRQGEAKVERMLNMSSKPQMNGHAPSSPEGLQPAHYRLLSAIAWWENIGVTSPDLSGVAFVAKTSTTSSAFNNNRSKLRSAGYIDYPSNGQVQLTEMGRAITPPLNLPLTNIALQGAIFEMVSPALGRLLRVLIAAYPEAVTLEDLAKRAETSETSSAFNNNRSWLHARGLAEYPSKGFVRATPLLFPEKF